MNSYYTCCMNIIHYTTKEMANKQNVNISLLSSLLHTQTRKPVVPLFCNHMVNNYHLILTKEHNTTERSSLLLLLDNIPLFIHYTSHFMQYVILKWQKRTDKPNMGTILYFCLCFSIW